jgi:hypothetical protein
VTITVGATAPMTTGAGSHLNFPPGAISMIWTLMLLGSGWLLLRNRKRLPALALPMVILVFASWGWDVGEAVPRPTTPGTPAGTYSATMHSDLWQLEAQHDLHGGRELNINTELRCKRRSAPKLQPTLLP